MVETRPGRLASIASAVEEQAAVTQEIRRSTQEAAERLRTQITDFLGKIRAA